MIHHTHNVDFIDQRLLALIFAEGSLFGKGFDRVFFAIFILDDQINGCKISFSDFLDRFEKFVESSLVEFSTQMIPPLKKMIRNIGVFQGQSLIVSFKLEGMRLTQLGSTRFLIIVSFQIEN